VIIFRDGYILGQEIHKLLLSRSQPEITKDRGVEVVGRRVLASLIDCSLVTPLSSVAFAPLLFVQPGLILILVLLLSFVLLFCIFYVAYVALFESFRGQTPGKMLLGIAMIREVDGAPGPPRAHDYVRGVFVMLASPKRQRPGDMAAGTLVVRKGRGYPNPPPSSAGRAVREYRAA
jgi:uncharacterized RDD family membrane protein YckC